MHNSHMAKYTFPIDSDHEMRRSRKPANPFVPVSQEQIFSDLAAELTPQK